MVSSVWYKALSHPFQARIFWAWHRRRRRRFEWIYVSRLTNAEVMKIGIKAKHNKLSITQPCFADATIFFPKKLLIFRNRRFWTQERKTIIIFAYHFVFSRSILVSFIIHIYTFTLKKVYSVLCRADSIPENKDVIFPG